MRPEVMAEVSVDRAVVHGGVFRHPVRFKRVRLDHILQRRVEVGQYLPAGLPGSVSHRS